MKKNKGFTLTELLIVLALIAVLAVVTIAAINPIEQVRKAKDTGRQIYAGELLKAIERYQVTRKENPVLSPITPSITCEEIVNGGAVSDISGLDGEVSSWFPGLITKEDSRLYVGLLQASGLAKICYQVESAGNIAKAIQTSCFVSSKFYLCVPE
ncbi:MAG: type II secretion system protein [Patescibacteria group bacterium]